MSFSLLLNKEKKYNSVFGICIQIKNFGMFKTLNTFPKIYLTETDFNILSNLRQDSC